MSHLLSQDIVMSYWHFFLSHCFIVSCLHFVLQEHININIFPTVIFVVLKEKQVDEKEKQFNGVPGENMGLVIDSLLIRNMNW